MDKPEESFSAHQHDTGISDQPEIHQHKWAVGDGHVHGHHKHLRHLGINAGAKPTGSEWLDEAPEE
jgi:hypothetical protein